MSEERLSHVDRLVALALGKGDDLGDPKDPLREACPLLWEWIARTQVDKDRVKAPARITIQLTPGGVAVGIMDSALCASMDVACRHVHDAMEALETTLAGPNPPIRVWDGRDPKLRKKREST